ncbi:IucA/IucC family siderophore biosynthesis protein [Streptomyces sp. NBC_00006]|uniref:IucA/IucC family protein n=1 Tax=Streptomyces sp. NBC_00006 TaxID=2975619 RepID=UPI00224DE7BF|nr:IucA/IucC family siderophore biosynthesis protein [Streptomyces sp. NBC_00006]MCX5530796.1 IucA/IucC family siderophore biosynthesis protein [Streptomyces sp. NBC_00006]
MPNPPVAPSSEEPTELYDPPELTSGNWARAGARLLAKLIGEFAYEDILRPTALTPAGPGYRPYALPLPAGRPDGAGGGEAGAREGSGGEAGAKEAGGTFHFRARRGAYGSWQVDPVSMEWEPGLPGKDGPTGHAEREPTGTAGPAGPAGPAGTASAEGGREPVTDPLTFLLRAKYALGLDGSTLGHLIRELTVTLAADARLDHTSLTAPQLADLGYAELEGHQTGHPWLVLNKGRLGFSATDTSRWAPESRRPTRLPWIAVHTGLATYRGVAALEDPASLYDGELDGPTRELFAQALRARGLDPAAYLYLPVHPWQWDDIVLPLFAPSIATNDIVPLPTDGDLRLPQQSIRTFLNTARPDRHTVKLPLSIFNTLVWRGLPTERTWAAPAVTAWVHALRDADPFLSDECRVVLLGEVASVTVEHPLYDGLDEVPYQYKELLGAIWREPLSRHLAPGERARTLASLLHSDTEGRAFVAELVARSGLDPKTWLRRLFAALLPPLLRFLYRYGTVFSPHGENAIVVFDDQDVPVRLAVKDFVDDVNISSEPLPEHDSMPDDVREVLLTEDPAFLTQFIHSGLFVGVFRYLAPLYEEQLGLPEDEFWALVRAEILRHHARFPELKERYEMFDLLTPEIERLCLNRNRLHLDGYRDRADRPHAAVHGTVANPLHQP